MPLTGPGILRLVLLGTVTAILVARPLVPGEDPGLLSTTPDASGLVLGFLWLFATVLWAVWRAWTGNSPWRAGLLEVGLVLVTAGNFAGTLFAARYRHPAWLIAWESLVVLVAVVLIRQLTLSRRDRHAFLAVLLATGVSVATQTVYQYIAAASNLQFIRPAAAFSDPDLLACYILLLLPAAVGFAIFAWNRQDALLTTGAVLGLGVMIAALVLTQLERESRTLVLPLDSWQTGWNLGVAHPWLGVGPGNFDRYAARYQPPTAANPVSDPHNFLLETWTAGGVVGVVGLVLGFIALARGMAVRSPVGAASREAPASGPPRLGGPPEEEPPSSGGDTIAGWEYYLGGMGGLLLAFLLRGLVIPTEQIAGEATAAAVRAIVWFASFAVFHGLPWHGRSVAWALAGGVAAMLAGMFLVGGITFPSLAQPLWIAVALALNESQPDPVESRRLGWATLLPLPVSFAVCMVYFVLVLYPAASCAHYRLQVRLWRDQFAQTYKKDGKGKAIPLLFAVKKGLTLAAQADPSDTGPLLDRARWTLQSSDYATSLDEADNPETALERARKLDPLGKEPLLLEQQVMLRLAERFSKDRDVHLGRAQKLNDLLMDVDPTEGARAHYRVAETLHALKSPEWEKEARLALQLDEEAPGPTYRLAEPQKEQVRRWLGLPSEK